VVSALTVADERARKLPPVFAALLFGALLMQETELPWRLVGLPLALAALVLGGLAIHAMAVLRRANRPAPGNWLFLALGLGLTTVLLTVLAFEAAFYPLVAEDERCRARATTLQAEQRCAEEFSRRLDGFAPSP
jgi:hypothetical protein